MCVCVCVTTHLVGYHVVTGSGVLCTSEEFPLLASGLSSSLRHPSFTACWWQDSAPKRRDAPRVDARDVWYQNPGTNGDGARVFGSRLSNQTAGSQSQAKPTVCEVSRSQRFLFCQVWACYVYAFSCSLSTRELSQNSKTLAKCVMHVVSLFHKCLSFLLNSVTSPQPSQFFTPRHFAVWPTKVRDETGRSQSCEGRGGCRHCRQPISYFSSVSGTPRRKGGIYRILCKRCMHGVMDTLRRNRRILVGFGTSISPRHFGLPGFCRPGDSGTAKQSDSALTADRP